MQKPPAKDFQRETIRILRPVPDGERGTELAVIRWITDGTSYAPQLVNQEVYIDRIDRRRKYGKMKGMRWADFKFLTETPERLAEILDLLLDLGPGKHKPAARRSGQDAAANDNTAQEAPHPADDEPNF